MKSTFNPIYMGSDYDYKGDRLEVVVAENGQRVNKVSYDHHQQFEVKCHKVCDGVYQSVGYGMSNVCMIEGETGMILVDSNNSNEAAALNLAHFREVCDKPVSAVMYSHYHYCSGTEEFLKSAISPDIDIWAHEDHVPNMLESYTDFLPFAYRRNFINNGLAMPPEGELAQYDSGLGGSYVYPHLTGFTNGYLPPNKLIPNVEKMETTIDGVKFEFYPAFSECSDSIIIYLPEKKCALTNHAWPVMANLYTLRGDIGRNPLDWMNSIDILRKLRIEHLGGCHGVPISGGEELYDMLTRYRDLIQYVYDQTIYGMNLGKDPAEILKDMEVPGYFTNARCSQECYGEVEYSVRGIFRTFIGWFGWDPVELHPVTKEFEAERLIKMVGGIDNMVSEARTALTNKEYSWAAQLATYVLKLEPDHSECRFIKADAFKEMACRTSSAHTRSWYATGWLALMTEHDFFKQRIRADKNQIRTLPAEMVIKSMPIYLIPEKARDLNKTVQFNITDTGMKCGFYMRPYVAEFAVDIVDPEVEIICDTETIKDLYTTAKNYAELVEEGRLTFKGDVAFGKEMGNLFDF